MGWSCFNNAVLVQSVGVGVGVGVCGGGRGAICTHSSSHYPIKSHNPIPLSVDDQQFDSVANVIYVSSNQSPGHSSATP